MLHSTEEVAARELEAKGIEVERIKSHATVQGSS